MKHLKGLTAAALALGVSGILTALPTGRAEAAAPDGKAVFERNCSVCHSVLPPPKSAPPITPIGYRYRQQFPSKEQGVARMVSFMKSPTKEKVLADPQAVTRFGLMPAMQLSDAELKAVAEWVWEQGGSGAFGRGQGGGQGGNCAQPRK